MSKSEPKNVQGQTNEQQNNQQQNNPQQSDQQQASQRSGTMQSGGQGGQSRPMASGGPRRRSAFSLTPMDVLSASPFALMARFTEEMNRMFEEFGLANQGQAASGATRSGSQAAIWAPPIEVFEREGNLTVRAELPGVDNSDVRVELTDEGLVIQGERKEEHEENREGFYRSERVYGRFYRLIPLPEDIDPEQIRANFDNGVLEITVPVAQTQQRRREIPVSAQGGQQSQAASARQQK